MRRLNWPAVAVGLSLAAAAPAAASTVVFGGNFVFGQSRTYVVTFGDNLLVDGMTPYINVTGHGVLGNYYAYQNQDGTISTGVDYFNDAIVDLTCKGLADCTRSITNFNGGAATLTVDVDMALKQMIISFDDQFGTFDNCGPNNTHFCAMSVSSPLSLVAAFKSEDGDPDVTFHLANSGVPEPSAWALMIAGFGLVGSALRRRSGAQTGIRA